jgi:hypothetical protein
LQHRLPFNVGRHDIVSTAFHAKFWAHSLRLAHPRNGVDALCLENFESVYKPIVKSWIHYDCAGEEPVIVERGGNP